MTMIPTTAVKTTVGNNPSIAATVGNNPSIAATVGNNPSIAANVGNNPSIAANVGNNPSIAANVGNNTAAVNSPAGNNPTASAGNNPTASAGNNPTSSDPRTVVLGNGTNRQGNSGTGAANGNKASGIATTNAGAGETNPVMNEATMTLTDGGVKKSPRQEKLMVAKFLKKGCLATIPVDDILPDPEHPIQKPDDAAALNPPDTEGKKLLAAANTVKRLTNLECKQDVYGSWMSAVKKTEEEKKVQCEQLSQGLTTLVMTSSKTEVIESDLRGVKHTLEEVNQGVSKCDTEIKGLNEKLDFGLITLHDNNKKTNSVLKDTRNKAKELTAAYNNMHGVVVVVVKRVNEAKTTAEGAKTTAEGATTTAEGARTTAEGAKTTAEGAKTTAEEAKTTAEGAKKTAEGAKTTAEAVSTALANHKSEWSGLDGKVNTAVKTFNEAQALAKAAQEDFATTKASVELLLDMDKMDLPQLEKKYELLKKLLGSPKLELLVKLVDSPKLELISQLDEKSLKRARDEDTFGKIGDAITLLADIQERSSRATKKQKTDASTEQEG